MMNIQTKNHERIFGFSVVGPQYLIVPEAEVTEAKASGNHEVILDRWWLGDANDDGQTFGLLFHVPAHRSDGGLSKAVPVYPMCNPDRTVVERLAGPIRTSTGLDLPVRHVPVVLLPKREDGATVLGIELIQKYSRPE